MRRLVSLAAVVLLVGTLSSPARASTFYAAESTSSACRNELTPGATCEFAGSASAVDTRLSSRTVASVPSGPPHALKGILFAASHRATLSRGLELHAHVAALVFKANLVIEGAQASAGYIASNGGVAHASMEFGIIHAGCDCSTVHHIANLQTRDDGQLIPIEIIAQDLPPGEVTIYASLTSGISATLAASGQGEASAVVRLEDVSCVNYTSSEGEPCF